VDGVKIWSHPTTQAIQIVGNAISRIICLKKKRKLTKKDNMDFNVAFVFVTFFIDDLGNDEGIENHVGTA
jgi:hypothetical protein